MLERKKVYVWDMAVRVFHWTLVPLFFISYLTGEESEGLHANVSYFVLGLITFRVIWGFIGSKYARFNNFIYPPDKVIEYLNSIWQRRPVHYTGHNPVGGLMVVLLLVFIFLSCWTGLVAYGKEGHGPLAQTEFTMMAVVEANGDENEAGKSEKDGYWGELHEFFSNVTLLLVFIHIAGVIVASRLHKENLVRAMITGRKTMADTDNSERKDRIS